MSKTDEVAFLAGGCFWGMESILSRIPGVIDTTVGYIGGTTKYPSYKEVCTGKTGHAEGLEVVFDPSQITFEKIVRTFFRMHDPTTLNRQHNDIGSQYRSAIFYVDEKQKQIALNVINELNRSGKFEKPLVTEVTEASPFYPAEEDHQDYLRKNPGGYNCHILRPE